jgi:L-ascorbate 6-phosphate lactonase
METKSISKLATALAECEVPAGSLAIGWLGQAGFVLKAPGGTLLAIDPYLSNSCEALGIEAGFDMKRLVPVQLAPEELLPFHAIAFTHSHQDHVDPETVQPYLRVGGRGPFIAPHEASDRLISLGATAEQIRLTWPNHVEVVGEFTIKATFAIPFDGGDLTHVGYLVEVRDGPRVYFTGDTDYNEILPLSIAPQRPDILATVINGTFRNLTPRDGALLAKAIGPRWVIPCHHDLFGASNVSDRVLLTNLTLQGIGESFCPLVHGEHRNFSRADHADRPTLGA